MASSNLSGQHLTCECGGKLAVVDTRVRTDPTLLTYYYRQRKCSDCSRRSSTYELDIDVAKQLLKLRKFLLENKVQ